MIEQDTKKQTDTEFVCKLIDMIQKYPKIINWTNDGKKMIIFNILEMEQLVLPQYFRHSNFPSFIRQLNMYDFHKLQKIGNTITFKNDIFVRGNEKNFHFIQRKKRIKQQFLQSIEFQKKCENILKRLNQEEKIGQETKDVIQYLLQFKYFAYENMKKMRVKLESVVKQLKDCRLKKITESVKLITNQLMGEMGEELRLSKEIDGMMERGFLVQRGKDTESKQVLVHTGNMLSPQFYIPTFTNQKLSTREIFLQSNRLVSRHSFMNIQQSNGHIWSMNDVGGFQPILLSMGGMLSQGNLGCGEEGGNENGDGKGLETWNVLNDGEDDNLSMGRLDEDELKEILKGEEDGVTIQNDVEELKE